MRPIKWQPAVGMSRVYVQVLAWVQDGQLCEFRNVCLEMSLANSLYAAASPQKHCPTPAGGTGL